MPRLPDTSEFYTGQRAVREEVNWILNQSWKGHLDFLNLVLLGEQVKSIVEFGCGSGLLCAALPAAYEYVGFDKNAWFIGKARQRCPGREFVIQDIRDTPLEHYDLACAFAFLKNFALDEWDDILGRVLAQGRIGCVQVQLSEVDFDNGTDYHHVFVTNDRLKAALKVAGHAEVSRVENSTWRVDDYRCAEVYLWTRRI